MSDEMVFPGFLIANLLDDSEEDPSGMELIDVDRIPVSDSGYCWNEVIIKTYGCYYKLEFDDKHYTNEVDAVRDIELVKGVEVMPVEKVIVVYEKVNKE